SLNSSSARTPRSFFTHPPPPEIYTLSLHDALPISILPPRCIRKVRSETLTSLIPFKFCKADVIWRMELASTTLIVISRTLLSLRSEEHTSELQSRENLVCRLLLEKKKKNTNKLAKK